MQKKASSCLLLVTLVLLWTYLIVKSTEYRIESQFKKVQYIENEFNEKLEKFIEGDEDPSFIYKNRENETAEVEIIMPPKLDFPKSNDDEFSTKLVGFEFCSVLDYSKFYRNTRVIDFKTEGAKDTCLTKNLPFTDNVFTKFTQKELTDLIDVSAQQIFKTYNKFASTSSEFEEMKRFSCFSAAMGNVLQKPEITKISDGVWLKEVDTHFFNSIHGLFDNKQLHNISIYQKAKKKFNLAFLITTHRLEDLESLKMLNKQLVSEDTIVLIQVDSKIPELRKIISEYAMQQRIMGNHVYINVNPITVTWGMSSLLYAELIGFFELLELADWDYVINLSASDYTLRSPAFIYNYIQAKPSRLWIKSWNYKTYRIEMVCLRNHFSCFPKARRTYPWKSLYPTSKQSQWMILPRDFITYISEDSQVKRFLGWSEHSMFPDEFFFAMIAKNSIFKDRIENENKRYITPFNGPHPIWIKNDAGDGSFENLKEQTKDNNSAFFFRKVKVDDQLEIKSYADLEYAKFDLVK